MYYEIRTECRPGMADASLSGMQWRTFVPTAPMVLRDPPAGSTGTYGFYNGGLLQQFISNLERIGSVWRAGEFWAFSTSPARKVSVRSEPINEETLSILMLD